MVRGRGLLLLALLCALFPPAEEALAAQQVGSSAVGPDLPIGLRGAVRTVTFYQNPIPIYTRTGMITLITFPRPILHVDAGGEVDTQGQGEYTFGVYANRLVVKTNRDLAYTNVAVHTEGVVYLLTLVESSSASNIVFDSHVMIADPLKRFDHDSPRSLVQLLYDLYVPSDFFLTDARIVRYGVEDVVYHREKRIALWVGVKDCLFLPRHNRTVLRLTLANRAPKYLPKEAVLKPFTVTPEGINIRNVRWSAVAMPEHSTFLALGEETDVFVFVNSASLPERLEVQVEVEGAVVPVTLMLPRNPQVIARPALKDDPQALARMGSPLQGGAERDYERMILFVAGYHTPEGVYVPPHREYFHVLRESKERR